MTEREWSTLAATPGALARRQALTMLARELAPWERSNDYAKALRGWARAVLADDDPPRVAPAASPDFQIMAPR